MARPKLSDDRILKDFGIKLHDDTVADIVLLAEEWDMAKSSVARELLLLGLAVVKASQHSKIIRLAPGLQFSDHLPEDPDITPVHGGQG